MAQLPVESSEFPTEGAEGAADHEPSAPPMEDEEQADNWYPQLQPKSIPQPGANEDPQPDQEVISDSSIIDDHFSDDARPSNLVVQDEEKKHQPQESEIYEFAEGVASIASADIISLQPEGKQVAPSESQVKSRSFTPKAQKIDIPAICKQLNGTLGIFKSKQKRINAFSQMAITTNRAQRQEIRQFYQKTYKDPLIRIIQKNFKGALREILVFLMMSEEEFVAEWIAVALKKKDVNLLTLLICTQSSSQALQSVRERYDNENKTSMVDKIDGLTSNLIHKRNINKFLLGLIKTKRDNTADIDMKLVEKDVSNLIAASLSKKQLDKTTYISIFTQRSLEHLYFVSVRFEEQNKTSLIDIVKTLWKESSETAYAIKVLLYYATRRHELFANCLGQAVNEPGPNFVMFLRVIVERAEIDLGNVIELYGENALRSFIGRSVKKKDPDAAKIVNALCGFNQANVMLAQ